MRTFMRFFFSVYSFVGLAIAVASCHSGSNSTLDNPLIAEGKTLAEKHCGSCHMLPSPELLDKETWVKSVLPAMAPNLGLEAYPGGNYYAGPKSAISFENWQKLIAYYETLAPPKLKDADVVTEPVNDWAVFSLEKPQTDTTKTAMTTMVAIDTIGHRVYSSDAFRSDITQWNRQLQATGSKQLQSAAAQATFFRDKSGAEQGVFTCMGTMRAADISRGELVTMSLSGKQPADTSIVYANLPRPLQSVAADLNKDGLMDWVVAGFGHLQGGLYWLKQQPNNSFTKVPIWEVAGAIQSTVGDFNADGWPDLVVLFAHADEGIWLFLNDKKGGFVERNLLRFPSVYGSTSFQLVDINKDGRLDILYTCGDNSDYSKIMKPYHGLYVYLNEGDFRLKQAYFYPINGCTKAMAADFDLDGDLDIATIAFFADFLHNPGENFQYFEQQKPLTFQSHVLPIHTYGRWICMDVNDIDQDGDADVVLGNFSQTFIIQKELKPAWGTHLPLVVLKNKTR
ncbi:FG-GAP-like repeat-containing protein [Spirosoma aerolatum]|uniref:FG-GAP-like repeat-containing protein n=1 Tax=Spirosoma aerolatum TaxID=1211326 RepID=UPI0009ADAA07|nr:FG-GAP-like repeat-containing protein [Spirosoma aerolatum]